MLERLVLGTQREFDENLGMWEYLRIEIYRFMKVSDGFGKLEFIFSLSEDP